MEIMLCMSVKVYLKEHKFISRSRNQAIVAERKEEDDHQCQVCELLN